MCHYKLSIYSDIPYFALFSQNKGYYSLIWSKSEQITRFFTK